MDNKLARQSRLSGRWVIRLFPRAWRRRYADELIAILELQPPSLRQLLGLLYCALDAHLDPQVSDGGEFSFMEGRPTMHTRIVAAAAAGSGLVLLFGLIVTIDDGLAIRLALFYGLAALGLVGMHRRQIGRARLLAWAGFVPALAAYSLSLVGVLAGFTDVTLPAIASRSYGFFMQEAFWISSALFGAVTLAIGVLPRPAALALAIGAPLAMIGMFLGPEPDSLPALISRIGVIMYGGSFIWLGLSGWAPRPRPMTSTA